MYEYLTDGVGLIEQLPTGECQISQNIFLYINIGAKVD